MSREQLQPLYLPRKTHIIIMDKHLAYYAAKLADDRFQAELVRVYGKNACNARYWVHHDDAGVLAAKEIKIAADKVWLSQAVAS